MVNVYVQLPNGTRRLIFTCDNLGLKIRERESKLIFLLRNQIYVVDTQKIRLNETVLMSTQTLVWIDG